MVGNGHIVSVFRTLPLATNVGTIFASSTSAAIGGHNYKHKLILSLSKQANIQNCTSIVP